MDILLIAVVVLGLLYLSWIHLELRRIRQEIPRAVANLGAAVDRVAANTTPPDQFLG